MASFKTYGATFEVPDRYTEGYALSVKEAAALNRLRAELISHKVRAKLDLSKGEEPSAEQVAEINAFIAGQAETFEFGVGRVPGAARTPTDPIEAEALKLARAQVRAAIAKAGLTLGKKGEEAAEGVYSFDRFEAKVDEVAELPKVIAAAKKIVAARTSTNAEDDGITL